MATGTVLGKCYPKHRAKEFKKFLGEIDAAVPDELAVHIVLDNLATHKTPLIKRWLNKRPAIPEDVKELVETIISDSWSFPALRP